MPIRNFINKLLSKGDSKISKDNLPSEGKLKLFVVKYDTITELHWDYSKMHIAYKMKKQSKSKKEFYIENGELYVDWGSGGIQKVSIQEVELGNEPKRLMWFNEG